MRPEVQSEEAILRYLLGESTSQEWQQVEDEYFDDPDFLAQIDAVEADLIDRYVLGLLSAGEREKFEQYVLNSPSQQQKVEFARELHDLVKQEREQSPIMTDVRSKNTPWREPLLKFFRLPKFSLGLATAALVIAVGGGWLIVETVRLRRERATLQQQKQELAGRLNQQQEENNQVVNELRERIASLEAKVTSPAASVLAFLLKSALSRSVVGERGKVTLPRGTETFGLKLQLPPGADNYTVYRAVVETGDGKEILRRTVKGKKPVTVVVQARQFDSQAYNLMLQGKTPSGEFEEVGVYPFTVVKK